MKLLVDMNLSPAWVSCLAERGFDAIHWSSVGKPDAPDREIFDHARAHGRVIFTHDLDFTAMLALTRARKPSVIQMRVQDVSLERMGPTLMTTLTQCAEALERGAIVTILPERNRVRVLPL